MDVVMRWLRPFDGWRAVCKLPTGEVRQVCTRSIVKTVAAVCRGGCTEDQLMRCTFSSLLHLFVYSCGCTDEVNVGKYYGCED